MIIILILNSFSDNFSQKNEIKLIYYTSINISIEKKEVDKNISSRCNGSSDTAHKLVSCKIQKKREFLELVEIAQPKIIYHRRRMHFFAFDGFVMYTFECEDSDFKQKVLHAIEFSNERWSE